MPHKVMVIATRILKSRSSALLRRLTEVVLPNKEVMTDSASKSPVTHTSDSPISFCKPLVLAGSEPESTKR